MKKHFYKMLNFKKVKFDVLTVVILILKCCNFGYALGASAIKSKSDISKPLENTPSTIVEYFKDHEVTEKQARDSLRLMKDDDFLTPDHCKPCKDKDIQYCNSENLLKDHCCCNQSHKKGE